MREYKTQTKETIITTTFSTPLGEMFAAASKKGIVILTFFTPFNIEAKIQTLKTTLESDIIPGNCEFFDTLKIQLQEYFEKKRITFEIPLQLVGSSFQVKCWKELLNIPYGKTVSTKELAIKMNDIKIEKAIFNASSQNMIEILVPSHRVLINDELKTKIEGIEKKEFLIKLEKNDK